MAAAAPERLRIGVLMPWVPVANATNSVAELVDVGEFIAPAIVRSVENINQLRVRRSGLKLMRNAI
eukprot:9562852-Prorocentrum_lima.AAC.1